MYRFFNDPATRDAIEHLGGPRPLAVFVGAGASAEVGLPTWTQLIDQLSDDLVDEIEDEDHRESVKRFVSDAGALTAAERIQRTLGDEILTAKIRGAIYGNDPPDLIGPGPLSMAVARLKAAEPSVRVLTTNYDQLLVRALRDIGERADSFCTNSIQPSAVVHLHGVIGFEDPVDGANQVVLSESDFLAPQQGGWRRDAVNAALSNCTCLFLGVSLTDLNLLTPLHSQLQDGGTRHFVLFTRRSGLDPEVSVRIEEIDRNRFEAIGVRPLYVDNYGEVGQFVDEVRLRRAHGDGYSPLPTRLETWQSDTMSVLEPSDPEHYREVQTRLSAALSAMLDDIQQDGDLDLDIGDEVMQLGLFAYGCDPGIGIDFARILAVSDRIMLDPRSSEHLPTNRGTKWTGVTAMISSKPVTTDYEHFASRWKYFLAVPIVAAEPLDCCIGAIVLSSTSSDSALALINLRQNSALASVLGEVGRRVLDLS